jgi:hypothetical protein
VVPSFFVLLQRLEEWRRVRSLNTQQPA